MAEITDPTYAEQLDAQDPLAHFRDQFVIDDPDLIYLDGNSLGRMPKKAAPWHKTWWNGSGASG